MLAQSQLPNRRNVPLTHFQRPLRLPTSRSPVPPTTERLCRYMGVRTARRAVTWERTPAEATRNSRASRGRPVSHFKGLPRYRVNLRFDVALSEVLHKGDVATMRTSRVLAGRVKREIIVDKHMG